MVTARKYDVHTLTNRAELLQIINDAKTKNPTGFFHQITITPKVAKELLARNAKNNRKIRMTAIAAYTAEMLAGRWGLSNDAIVLDVNGIMVNGQHRLHALIRAGHTADIWVWVDAPVDVITHIDSGAVRTAEDRSRTADLNLEPGASAAFNLMNLYGRYQQVAGTNAGKFMHYAVSDPRLVDAVNFAQTRVKACKGRGSYSPAVASVVARAAYHEVDPDQLTRFAVLLTASDDDMAKEPYEQSVSKILYSKLREIHRLSDGSGTTKTRIRLAEVALSKFLKQQRYMHLRNVENADRCWMLDEKPTE
jgi:hypothetical protein